MTKYQQDIFDQIQAEKRMPKPDKKLLKKLAHQLTEPDSREWELRHTRRNDPGGRSRSPSMGRWDDYSNAY